MRISDYKRIGLSSLETWSVFVMQSHWCCLVVICGHCKHNFGCCSRSLSTACGGGNEIIIVSLWFSEDCWTNLIKEKVGERGNLYKNYSRVRYGMVWYGMAWYMVWYGMVWYGMVWYGMVWYGMVWYGIVWYGMVWHGMV